MSSQNATSQPPSKHRKQSASGLSPQGFTSYLFGVTKYLLTPSTYGKQNILTQWQRSRRVTGLMNTVRKGLGYAWHVQNTPNIEPHKIIGYIQSFCQKSLTALDIEVVAVKPIPTTHALWASNHISWLDIPVVGSIIPTFFLSKAEIAKWPVIGWLARSGNTLFIERGSGDASNVASQMSKFLADGFPVVFFPEATTTDGTAIKRIHGKLLQASIDSQVPVQPIVICYVNHRGELDTAIPYYGDIGFLDSVRRVLDNRPAKAYVLPLEPISPVNTTKAEMTRLLQQRMNDGLKSLHYMVLHRQP